MRLIDLHCDTISRVFEMNESMFQNSGQFDLNRAIGAGISMQIFSLFLYPDEQGTALKGAIRQLECFFAEAERHSDVIYPVFCCSDYQPEGKRIGAVLHLEGAEALGTELEFLRMFYRLGLRSVGLTWNRRNLLADGVMEGESAGGLSRSGIKMVQEMRSLGMLLDLSHISPAGFFQAIDCYQGPVLVTHANARRLCNHPRNLDDAQLKKLAENGGIIGVNQVSDFVRNDKTPDLEDFLDHLVYISELIGVEHVALGSDFDGADNVVLPGIEAYAQLENAMLRRGFEHQELEMIFHNNVLRVLNQILK